MTSKILMVCLLFCLIQAAFATDRPSLSCSSMKKSPVWSKFKCWAACQAINCSTGECRNINGRATCDCACKKGPVLIDAISKLPIGKGR
ncbi:unnamed protein product, partial [Mesorhabditis spiculigera]